MKKKHKIVALIPLRGGSKRVPYKNIKKFGGRPLAYWVASSAIRSKYIDDVHISTEDEKIKKIMLAQGLNIKIVHRPNELAEDSTPEELVHLHFMEQVPFDILVIIHATNPLTTADDLDLAIEKFQKEGYDSMVTGTRHKRFYWTPDGMPLNYDPLRRPRTQDFHGTITENGAFYITRPETLKKYRNFLGGRIGIYEMRSHQSIDIDDPQDWKKAEQLFKRMKNKRHEI